jgi:hypothetical protein
VELTRLLRAWQAGDSSVLERQTPVVYAEFHRIAQRNLANGREVTCYNPRPWSMKRSSVCLAKRPSIGSTARIFSVFRPA